MWIKGNLSLNLYRIGVKSALAAGDRVMVMRIMSIEPGWLQAEIEETKRQIEALSPALREELPSRRIVKQVEFISDDAQDEEVRKDAKLGDYLHC